MYHSAACRKADNFEHKHIRVDLDPKRELDPGDRVLVYAQVRKVARDGLVEVGILDGDLRRVTDCFIWRESLVPLPKGKETL